MGGQPTEKTRDPFLNRPTIRWGRDCFFFGILRRNGASTLLIFLAPRGTERDSKLFSYLYYKSQVPPLTLPVKCEIRGCKDEARSFARGCLKHYCEKHYYEHRDGTFDGLGDSDVQ